MWKGNLSKIDLNLGRGYCYKQHELATLWLLQEDDITLTYRYMRINMQMGKSRNLSELLHFSLATCWPRCGIPSGIWRFGSCHHKGVGCTRSQGSSIWLIKVQGLGQDLKSWGWNLWREKITPLWIWRIWWATQISVLILSGYLKDHLKRGFSFCMSIKPKFRNVFKHFLHVSATRSLGRIFWPKTCQTSNCWHVRTANVNLRFQTWSLLFGFADMQTTGKYPQRFNIAAEKFLSQ